MKRLLCLSLATLLLPRGAFAAEFARLPDSDPEFDMILASDIAELTVTSVSKRPQDKKATAAAIYVITSEDLHRIGATSVPEALRVVPGLEVARVSAHRWAVTSRGFNNVLASKLLVLIDGRSIYTPVFSGTYWDDQTPLMDDIERIEVIRGPGATLYGANAVNGIINIITKHSSDTLGNYALAAGGNEEGMLAARRGVRSGNSTYRAYAQYHTYDATERLGGGNNADAWSQGRAGFRMDSTVSARDDFTFQGDAFASRYDNEIFQFLPSAALSFEREDQSSHGGNVLGRWNRRLDAGSRFSLQGYADFYERNEIAFDQRVGSFDVHFQHDMALDARNLLTWGGGMRYNMQRHDSTFSNSVLDEHVNRAFYDIFVQDEYAVLPQELYFTLGSKFEHNPYTGFVVQPSARLSWQPDDKQTVWAAVSRAMRTPSEIERQSTAIVAVVAGTPPQSFGLTGSFNYGNEELIAYEVGYRVQPRRDVSFDVTAFYNDYDHLGTLNPFGTPYPYGPTELSALPITNLGEGRTYGGAAAVDWNVSKSWRLSGSYSFLQMDVRYKAPAIALVFDEDLSPQHQFAIQSYYNLAHGVQWNNMLYFVDEIATANAYLRYDTVLTWQALPQMELSLVGRNLLDNRHAEMNAYPQAEIERSVLGMATWRF